jgi:hypothetical protein
MPGAVKPCAAVAGCLIATAEELGAAAASSPPPASG